ncbi:MAG TPA: hypothetical protein VL598_11160 [Trinickia sp.]|jgi:flagellar biosynthesis/type III secretory pathway M-ring protein FliF/YscJ|uniref:hypothetical protein n=1 Tax=Trinickia sp. TaxID=2571163 RepID=UPI002CDD9263|nr:hypothetical protein [Trinickia sp.]HTI18212.1 hypothetical protein [Trinickia sp.]
MKNVDKRLDLQLAKWAAEVDRAQRFVSQWSTQDQQSAVSVMPQRNSLPQEETSVPLDQRATLIARQDPKYVAAVIKGWMADER